jgi:peptidyl-prolyl cis-trans isomerase C
MSKPMFNTTSPVFDSGSGADKAATAIVADVAGRSITMGEVGDAIRALPPSMANLPFETVYPGVLSRLITTTALAIHAQNKGLDDDPAVRRKVRAATDAVLSDEYLRREGSKGITEEALLARYKRDIEGRPGPVEVRARAIVVPTEKEANDLIAEITGGADFATVARRSSKDPTASIGGELGFNTREKLNSEVGSVIFSLAVGQVTPYPVRSIGSWFILKVEERRQQPTPSFASMRDELSHELLQEAASKITFNATDGLQVRQFDMLGRDTSAYTRPER